MSETTGGSYLKQHQLSGDALLFDMGEQTESLLNEARQSNVKRAARTLVKDGPLRLTVVGFTSGGELREHKAGGHVSIDVLKGEVEIKIGDRSERLDERKTLVLGSNIEHSLVAQSDAVILLTIAMA